VGPACRSAAAGYAPPVARACSQTGPSSPLSRRRPACNYPCWRHHPRPAIAPPAPPTSPWRPPWHRGGTRSTTSPSLEMEPSPVSLPAGPVGAPSAASPARPPASAAAPGAVPAPAVEATQGSAGNGPTLPVRPPVLPGLRLPLDPNGREWRKPPRPAGAATTASAGGKVATSLVPAASAGPASSLGGGPAVVPEERPPLLGQAASALPPRPAPPAVRAWLAPLGATAATADWPLVSDVSQQGAYESTNFRTTRIYSTPAILESNNILATSS